MKRLLQSFSLLVVLMFVSSMARSQETYSFTYDGKNYEIVKDKKSWADAATYAVSRGGYLVHIDDSLEQIAVYDAIVNGAAIADNYTTVMDGGGIAYIWIGATDKTDEGKWVWDGKNEGLTYTFWTGQGAAGNDDGMAVNNAFVNWGGKVKGTINEPDDYGAGQDGAALALKGWPAGTTLLGSPGEWNDIALTNELYFIIEDVTPSAINENDGDAEINIFPNPAHDFISISSNLEIERIQVFAADGSLVYYENNLDMSSNFDIRELDAGVYYIVFETKDSRYQELIIKQ